MYGNSGFGGISSPVMGPSVGPSYSGAKTSQKAAIPNIQRTWFGPTGLKDIHTCFSLHSMFIYPTGDARENHEVTKRFWCSWDGRCSVWHCSADGDGGSRHWHDVRHDSEPPDDKLWHGDILSAGDIQSAGSDLQSYYLPGEQGRPLSLGNASMRSSWIARQGSLCMRMAGA
eukprot:3924178-Rhodomonas_salina.2